MGWVKFESFRLYCPDFAAVFAGREAAERLEAACKVLAAYCSAVHKQIFAVTPPGESLTFDDLLEFLSCSGTEDTSDLGEALIDDAFRIDIRQRGHPPTVPVGRLYAWAGVFGFGLSHARQSMRRGSFLGLVLS